MSLQTHPTLQTVLPPTRRRFLRPTEHVWKVSHPTGEDTTAAYDSRAVRKGRLPLRLHRHTSLPDSHEQPIPIRVRYEHDHKHLKKKLHRDISFWVAMSFWWGSAVWVANGFTVWLAVVRPETESKAMATTASALAFVGGTVFEIGAYLGLLEAGNRGKHTDFGSSVDQVLFGYDLDQSKKSSSSSDSDGASHQDVEHQKAFDPKPDWEWLPKMRLHDLGYLAALVQMFAATIFWVSTITGLPGVIPGFSDGEGSKAIIDVFFWLPQVIGGIGFCISSLLLMLEVQPGNVWWKLKPLAIGWQIGVWNLIGAVGFLLCGALGFSSSSKAIWQSDLSTFWGGWGFLIGSTFQVYEAMTSYSS